MPNLELWWQGNRIVTESTQKLGYSFWFEVEQGFGYFMIAYDNSKRLIIDQKKVTKKPIGETVGRRTDICSAQEMFLNVLNITFDYRLVNDLAYKYKKQMAQDYLSAGSLVTFKVTARTTMVMGDIWAWSQGDDPNGSNHHKLGMQHSKRLYELLLPEAEKLGYIAFHKTKSPGCDEARP